jgi:hypothetical protein
MPNKRMHLTRHGWRNERLWSLAGDPRCWPDLSG